MFLPMGAVVTCASAAEQDEMIKRSEVMSKYADVQEFIRKVSKKHGFEDGFVAGAMSKVYFDYTLIVLMDRPAEKHPWQYYSRRILSKERMDGGRAYLKEHEPSFQTAAAQWKVPPEVIAAIIGVESTYGTAKFKRNAVESLGTLAFEYPRRSSYFKSELEHLFVLAHREKEDPLSYVASYAGAIGIAQFMPSNIIAYGRDGDHDGRVDIVKSHADAIHSVACYISKHGWQPGKHTVAFVSVKDTVPGSAYSLNPCDASRRQSVKALKKMGVSFSETYPDDALGILSRLDEDNDTYTPVVFFENACPIHRYNRSLKYTAAISALAKSLEKPKTQATAPASRKK